MIMEIINQLSYRVRAPHCRMIDQCKSFRSWNVFRLDKLKYVFSLLPHGFLKITQGWLLFRVGDQQNIKVSRSWELRLVVPIGYRHLSGKKCGVHLDLFVDCTSLGVVAVPCFLDICSMATAAQSEGPDPFISCLYCDPDSDSRLQQCLLGRLL